MLLKVEDMMSMGSNSLDAADRGSEFPYVPSLTHEAARARLERLVRTNDEHAEQIWHRHAQRLQARLPGALLVPLYRCFSARDGVGPGFHQLTAPLLFIGINPATPVAKYGLTRSGFQSGTSAPLEALKKYEVKAEHGHRRHFDPYRETALAVTDDPEKWAHLDMFLLRESVQKSMEPHLHVGVGKQRFLDPFFAEQLEQFKWTLRAHSPRCVVFANRGASSFARKHLGLEKTEDLPDAAYPLYQWKEMPGVHIVLGSVLSGRWGLRGEKLLALHASARRGLLGQ